MPRPGAEARPPTLSAQRHGSGTGRTVKAGRRQSARAFTLVEMVVVISIILLILGFVVPAASTLWKDRKRADAVNTIQGLLMTTRARALQPDGLERGFFAFVDRQGAQHFVSIEKAEAPDPADIQQQLTWANIFRVTDDEDRVLPAPMRVVPRYVVNDPNDPNYSSKQYAVFSEEELANEDFDTLPTAGNVNQAQRHRNYFTIVFSAEGQLLVNRDILILDPDIDGDGLGDRTGLRVGPDLPAATPTTSEFYRLDDTANPKADLDPNSPTTTIGFLVVDPEDDTVALNFPSVDGPLVYNDALFVEMPDATAKREMLIRTGRPLYLSRWTGSVIRGPIGENEPPP